MAKTAMIRARVEPDLKQEAEEVFSRLGLSSTEAHHLVLSAGNFAARPPVWDEYPQRRDL